MNVVDILIAIVVVTILVTIILAIMTYLAYKLRLAREPSAPEDEEASKFRYFVPYEAPPEVETEVEATPAAAHADADTVGTDPVTLNGARADGPDAFDGEADEQETATGETAALEGPDDHDAAAVEEHATQA